MSEVLEEAWELVEHGLITEADFREFVFANPARLHTALQPRLLQGHGGGGRGGEAHSIRKCASVVDPVRPLMGRMS